MSVVDVSDEAARDLLRVLVDRVRGNLPISGLLAPGVAPDEITTMLRPVCAAPASIDSIGGHASRIDAVVTSGAVVARIVFARNEEGLVTWLRTYVKPPRFDGVTGGRVVVVNGPSGAGKSTLLRALQSVAPFPLVVLDEPEQIGTVQPGYLIWGDTAPALHRGYLAAIAALASAGNHVALSAGGHAHGAISDAFAGIPLIRVGLRCDIEVLVRREQRSGRWAGIAGQSLGVHEHWVYDLEVDTTDGPDAVELAQHVLRLLAPSCPTA